MSVPLFRASSGLLSQSSRRCRPNTEVTAEVTMWLTRCSRPWAFSLTGNLTLSLGMFAETDNEGNVSGRRITVSKLRGGQTGWGCDFTLGPHEIGTDDEGIEIMSAYVEPTNCRFWQTKADQTRTQSHASSAVDEGLRRGLPHRLAISSLKPSELLQFFLFLHPAQFPGQSRAKAVVPLGESRFDVRSLQAAEPLQRKKLRARPQTPS
jgi:hypothetical protein